MTAYYTAPTDLAVTYTIQCHACDRRHHDQFKTQAGCEVQRPYLPPSWVLIAGLAFCPDHQVSIAWTDGTSRKERRLS